MVEHTVTILGNCLFNRSRISGALALVAAALLVAGCGVESGESSQKPPDYDRALAGAPAPLAALHEQEGELLDGGLDAFERRIESLRGYPVIVNVWASWCGPCRYEFTAFQRASAQFGKRVAFLGVDSDDNEDAARTFLEERPVPYPSYSDPDKDIAESVGSSSRLPTTAFYDRAGQRVFVKFGNYADEEALRADIERCALARAAGCEAP